MRLFHVIWFVTLIPRSFSTSTSGNTLHVLRHIHMLTLSSKKLKFMHGINIKGVISYTCKNPVFQAHCFSRTLMPNIMVTWLASLLACFPYFEEMKVGVWVHLAVCVSAYVSPPNNFWIPPPIYMALVMYIMAPESISTAHSINPLISNTNMAASHIAEIKLITWIPVPIFIKLGT
jgi:hypothetical protein